MAVNFRGLASGFRIVGTVATPLHVMNIENSAGSAFYIAVYEWKVYRDMTAASTALTPILRVSAPTGTAAGGTALTKTKLSDTSGTNTSSASATIRHGASADGTASAITGVTAGTTTLWTSQPMKLVTAAGVMTNPEPDVIPKRCVDKPWVIAPGASLLLQIVGAGLTTDHYYTDVVWEEGTASTDWA